MTRSKAILAVLILTLAFVLDASAQNITTRTREYTDTATTVWAKLTVPKSTIAADYYHVRFEITGSGNLAFAFTSQDTANAFALESWVGPQTVLYFTPSTIYTVEWTDAAYIYIKSNSTCITNIKITW